MNRYLNFINLHVGEENKDIVLDNVRNNVSFRGANLWILACAIVIASVGLNVNSTAVIIGAMLISPLMGPIVGAGFSLGIFDFNLLKKSLKNLIIATFVSLFVAAAYFYLSPFKEAQSELLARTSPNIYDVLIAFFGGIVGAIAITRVEKGNPIPGVAIATALMPPLCTAGYGIAIGNFMFFLGAMYLYTINCVFICLSTFLIVKYLNYPAKKQVDANYEKKIRYIIYAIIVVLIVPSIYLAFRFINEKTFIQRAENFITSELVNKGSTVIYKKITYNSNPKNVEVCVLNRKFSADEIKNLNTKLDDYTQSKALLVFKQDTTNIRAIVQNEILGSQKVINEKDVKIAELEYQINEYKNPEFWKELQILFPEIKAASLANHTFAVRKDSIATIPIFIYESNKKLPEATETKLQEWLKEEFNKKEIKVMYF